MSPAVAPPQESLLDIHLRTSRTAWWSLARMRRQLVSIAAYEQRIPRGARVLRPDIEWRAAFAEDGRDAPDIASQKRLRARAAPSQALRLMPLETRMDDYHVPGGAIARVALMMAQAFVVI